MSEKESDTYAACVELPPRDTCPPEREERARRDLRRDVAWAIAENLADGQYWTIRLVENREPGWHPYRGDTLTVRAEIVRVEVRQTVMWEPPDYSTMSLDRLTFTATGEISHRIRRWARKAFRLPWR